MKKIYEDDWWYDHLRYIVDAYIHGSFKKIRYEGLERIPKDGAVIFAPNHCDALMDPFAVLAMDHSKKVFVARADIFRKPVLRKILTFFKIMPINRVRDGFRSVINTEETIEKSIEVLNNRVPFCILPEGMHRSMHSLLPLGKGIARIALGADKAIAGERPVYIVPLGCEYGDYYRFRSTLLVTVGEPVDISAFIAAHSGQSEAALLNDIRALVGKSLPGIPLIHSNVPPPGLPRRADTCYFALDSRDPLWAPLLENGACALFLPGMPEECSVNLVLINSGRATDRE